MASKKLGRLRGVAGYLAQNWTELVQKTWRLDPKLSGGGQICDSGTHLLAAILWLTRQEVKEVCAHVDNLGYDVDIMGSISMRLADGTLVSALISGQAVGFQQGLYFNYDRANIQTGVSGGRLEIETKSGPVKTQKMKPLPSVQDNFITSVLGSTKPYCPVHFGFNLSLLIDAIYRSAKLKKSVKVARFVWPTKREEFRVE